MVFIERSTLFITMLAMVLMGQNVTADVVFSMAQFFNVLQVVKRKIGYFKCLCSQLNSDSNS